MVTLTVMQWQQWLAQYSWPFIRIAACLMVAPIFGARVVPHRARLLLAVALSVMVAPIVAVPADVEVFSGTGLVIAIQQLLAGIAMGMTLQFIFDAVAMGGQLLANNIGLSFAANIDPLRGVSTPVLGQFQMILMTLIFLSLNGHVMIIESLVQSFTLLPVGVQGIGSEGLWHFVLFGGVVFSGALSIALPGMVAALVVNLAFGVMSRAAPSINLFGVGFPAILAFGLVIVFLSIPGVAAQFMQMTETVWQVINDMLVAHAGWQGGK